MKHRFLRPLLAAGLVAVPLAAALATDGAPYALNVLLRHGGAYWTPVSADDPRLSPAIRLARRDPAAEPVAGDFAWTVIAPGFETAELPVLVDGAEIDRLFLARIDPARFRFVTRNAPSGTRAPADWLAELGAVMVINGSYYASDGTPATPLLSAGTWLGPMNYRARHGAFTSGPDAAHIRDLAETRWRASFTGAEDGFVSFPLLLAADGTNRAPETATALANRSFVAEDSAGRILLGTSRDAFFTLRRLGDFLHQAPLDLTLALNLDGGPVACQEIALKDYHRDFCGQWETRWNGEHGRLLTWPYGHPALPVALAVVPR